MKREQLQGKYPVFTTEISKGDCARKTTKELMDFLTEKVESHPVAHFIAHFDHFSHTNSLDGGEIADGIVSAQILVFCFGKKLTNPLQLAVRPRSIGVAETEDRFILSFMEAPNPTFNDLMEGWIEESLRGSPRGIARFTP